MDQAKRNKRSYLDAKTAFNARDLDACIAFYAPDHRIVSRESGDDAPSIRRFLERAIAAWPDIELRVEHIVAEDDWVMGRSIAAATHSTAAMGAPPTQKRVETTFWDLHRFDANGLIIESWNLMDVASIMRQIASPQ
jgi:steroid delta-isomerase-like uncharacterized protein